jgi:hypothetical protein
VKVGDGETIAKREGDQLLSGAAIAVISMVACAFATFLAISAKGFALADDIVEVKVHEPKPFNLPGELNSSQRARPDPGTSHP